MPRLRLLVIALTMAGCGEGWEAIDVHTLPVAADEPDAAAVVLLDEHDLRFAAGDALGKPIVDETRHVRVRILREGGESVALVRVPYQPDFAEVIALAARTVAADGSTRQFGRRDAVDVPDHGDYVLYSDLRALILALAPARPGTVVEYRYTVRHYDQGGLRFAHTFGGGHPVRRSRLTVAAPSGWLVEHRASRLDRPVGFAPVERNDIQQWEQRQLLALPSEPLGAQPSALATTVAVRLVRWRELGKEQRAPADARALSAWEFTHTRPEPGHDGPRALAAELVRTLPADATARARRLHNWVRDEVAYCAVEIGLGGKRPHGADDVLRLRYGDCKDKANLLRELLAAVGIPSQLVALWAHSAGPPLPFELATQRANHVIVRVLLPGGAVMADPTAQTVPFGALPVSDQESDFLPLAAAGEPLGRTPASSADDNARELEVELAPAAGATEDDLVGTFRASQRGDFADRLRAQLVHTRADGQRQPLTQALGLHGWRLADWHIEGGGPPEAPAPVVATGQLARRGGWPRARVRLVTLAQLLGEAVPVLPPPPRRGPLVLPCRHKLEERLRLAVGATATVTLPRPVTLERRFGRYRLEWAHAGGALVATRSLRLHEHLFDAAAYAEVKQFFDEILAADARAVTIREPQP